MATSKKTLDVFYDFLCPYCYHGVTELMDMLPEYPLLSVRWYPCEAHPRPEFAPQHSDLAAAALLSVQDQNADCVHFNCLVYHAHFEEGKRIDDPAFLAALAKEAGADESVVLKALQDNKYAKEVDANNTLVWDTLAFEAVPSYRLGNKLLGSKGGIVVEKEALKAFLEA